MENNNLFEYLKGEQKRIEGTSEKYRRDANNIFFELPKHLILTATVFIALSSSVLALRDIKNSLVFCERFILISSIALITISIFIGMLQYIKDYNFFKRWVLFSSDMNKKIRRNEFKSTSDYDKELEKQQKSLRLESTRWPLITQSIFLLCGVLGFLFFIYEFLF